eukprot:7546658-Pyramimonas_sp.AAC.1
MWAAAPADSSYSQRCPRVADRMATPVVAWAGPAWRGPRGVFQLCESCCGAILFSRFPRTKKRDSFALGFRK